MADEKTQVNELELLKAKVEALEAAQTQPVGEAVTSKKGKAPALTGEAFKVDKVEYKVKYPVIVHNGKQVNEADILGNADLQKELVAKAPGVLVKLSTLLLFLFAFATAQASTVTINAHSAEVVATSFATRDFYQLQDLLIIYRTSTEAFEVQTAETRSKVWGGDIDSVTISGTSTAAQKLAFLRTLMLETTTTNGYRCFVGRNNLEFYYKSSTKRLDLKYGKNKQPLWFGNIDSLQVGSLTTATQKLAYLRVINKWRAQDCLPNTTAATIAAGAAAGSSPTVTVTGDAYSGLVSITTGTTATTGTLATVTLGITAPTGTHIVVEPYNGIAKTHDVRWYATSTTTTLVFTVQTTALSDATAYTFKYHTETY